MSPLPPCLTFDEAYARGTLRAYNADGTHRTHRYVDNPSLANEAYNNGMGAAAEWLSGQVTHRRWISGESLEPDKREDGDLEGAIQVRWTSHPYGRLIVHPEDPSWQRCLLVRGATFADMRLVAWCYAYEAQQEQWWRTNVPNPAYFYDPVYPYEVLIKQPRDPFHDL